MKSRERDELNSPRQDNLSDLGKKLQGWWTRFILNNYARYLIAKQTICAYIGLLLTWYRYKAKNEKIADRRELLEARFKMWYRKTSAHNYPWGLEDYKRILNRTWKERKAILKHYASPLCPDCYGRGEVGWLENTQSYIVCRCVKENILREKQRKLWKK